MPTSPTPDPWQARVTKAIEERWLPPSVAPASYTVPADRVEETARAALDAALTRDFRIGKFPQDSEYREMLGKVRHWVGRGQPIRVKIGYAPMKNLNVVSESRVDWAEFFALCHLAAWDRKISSVYPPGVRICIIFDDSTISMANRSERPQMKAYMSSVWDLVGAMGYRSLIVRTMKQSSFAWLFHFGPYQIARRRVRRWEQDPANREQLEMMHEFAKRNVVTPPGLDAAARERYCREASHRYRVYWQALQLSGFSKLGNDLIAMYLDGSQHHIRQQAAFHLRTLSKEQVTQPWQGEGALRDNGRGALLPFALTSHRRQRYETTVVSGLNVIPLPGFDRIQVAREREAPEPGGGHA